MSAPIPAIAVRGSTGVHVVYGPPSYEQVKKFPRELCNNCRILFSPNGQYFAWLNGTSLKIASTKTWELLVEVQRPKANMMAFSPQGTYIMCCGPYSVNKDNPEDSDNLHIHKTDTGKLVASFVHKKQIGWEPQWTSDESLCARLVNNEIVFYENQDFKKIVNTIKCAKVHSFSIAPSTTNSYHIMCYMPGKQDTPAVSRLYRYSKPEINKIVATKSFFPVDKVEFLWNATGTSVLLLTSTEVDKTGASYYGKQTLHYVGIKGATATVILDKEGPIHSVAWSPKSSEFCVIYGFMPAKATLFNTECTKVFDFGIGPRNAIYYNVHGNILLLGGFGNLRGSIELWDTAARKLIASCEAPDTTQLQWSSDGTHFMTATTAPRLRMGNGYKIWHYTGTLIYERPWNSQEELHEVCWQTFPQGVFEEKPINYKPVEGIVPSQPQASKQVYRPPSARGRESNFKLHEYDDASKKLESTPSKASLKQRKKREAQKLRRQTEEGKNPFPFSGNRPSTSPGVIGSSNSAPVGEKLSEKDKKIKNLQRKLDAIAKLKEMQASGKPLQINQLAKIKTQSELETELKELTL